MKKLMVIVMVSLGVFSITACSTNATKSLEQDEFKIENELEIEKENRRILLVEDVLYYETDKFGPMEEFRSTGGKITSTVNPGEIPTSNGESNFGNLGNNYTKDLGDGGIMVFVDNEWCWFESEDAEYIETDIYYFIEERTQKIGEFDTGVEVYFGEVMYNSYIFTKQDDVIKCIERMPYITPPKISPDHTKFTYIDSYGFEAIGNVLVYDSKTGESKKLTEFDYGDNQNTVKYVEWLDDEHLLLIVGFAFGTVTEGGDLYIYNLDSGEMELLVEANSIEQLTNGGEKKGRIEITDIEIEGSCISLETISWDEEYMEYEMNLLKVNRNDLLENSGDLKFEIDNTSVE